MARKRDAWPLMEQPCALHLPCVQPEKPTCSTHAEVQDIVALLDAVSRPRPVAGPCTEVAAVRRG